MLLGLLESDGRDESDGLLDGSREGNIEPEGSYI